MKPIVDLVWWFILSVKYCQHCEDQTGLIKVMEPVIDLLLYCLSITTFMLSFCNHFFDNSRFTTIYSSLFDKDSLFSVAIQCLLIKFTIFQTEEKLRVLRERKVKRLKHLDERGAEAYKVDSTQVEIRKLSTKIRIAIQVVESISQRINKLRDEELWPQINELIQGYGIKLLLYKISNALILLSLQLLIFVYLKYVCSIIDANGCMINLWISACISHCYIFYLIDLVLITDKNLTVIIPETGHMQIHFEDYSTISL